MENKSGSRQRGTPEAIHRVIAESEEPILTVGDIAEELDVTRQTIHNHIGVVEQFPDIKSKTIGQANGYWQEVDEPVTEFDLGSDIGISPLDQILIEQRAKWLFAKQRVFESEGQTDQLQVRIWFYNLTQEYLRRSRLSQALSATRSEDGVEYSLNDDSVYSDHFPGDLEAHLFDKHLFDSGWFGSVRGIRGVKEFDRKRSRRLKEIAAGDDYSIGDEYSEDADVEFDKSRITEQDCDELYPSISDTLLLGETVDYIVASSFDFRW